MEKKPSLGHPHHLNDDYKTHPLTARTHNHPRELEHRKSTHKQIIYIKKWGIIDCVDFIYINFLLFFMREQNI